MGILTTNDGRHGSGIGSEIAIACCDLKEINMMEADRKRRKQKRNGKEKVTF